MWEIVRTDAGFHVRLKAQNGEIVLTSEVYTARPAADRAAALAAEVQNVRYLDEREDV